MDDLTACIKFLKSKQYTVKLDDKERFDKEQIGVKELFTDYKPFLIIPQINC